MAKRVRTIYLKLGNQVARAGTSITIINPTIVATTNGMVPLYIVPILRLGCIPLRTNMMTPTGGVIPPRLVTQTKSKENQIPFIPRLAAIGKKIGSPMRIMGKISMKQPRIRKNTIVNIMKAIGDNPISVMTVVIVLVTLHQAINRVNICAPTRIRKTVDTVLPPSKRAWKKLFQEYRRIIKASRKAAKAPTAPPRVGVKNPM